MIDDSPLQGRLSPLRAYVEKALCCRQGILWACHAAAVPQQSVTACCEVPGRRHQAAVVRQKERVL